MSVIYISGPMTGLPEHNFPAFYKAQRQLELQGWKVLNPADNPRWEGKTWSEYIRDDIKLLALADSMYMLPGWQNSRGAQLEFHIAMNLGLKIIFDKDSWNLNYKLHWENK